MCVSIGIAKRVFCSDDAATPLINAFVALILQFAAKEPGALRVFRSYTDART